MWGRERKRERRNNRKVLVVGSWKKREESEPRQTRSDEQNRLGGGQHIAWEGAGSATRGGDLDVRGINLVSLVKWMSVHTVGGEYKNGGFP